MKLAVCLKEVIDSTLPLRVSPRKGEITQQSGSEPIRLINPADRAALEVAMQLAGQGTNSNVEAFSVCPPEATSVLHFALARGASNAERIPPLENASGPPATALALAQRFSGENFDAICCGDETLDNSAAAVGPLLAELLDLPVVSGVLQVRSATAGDKAVLERRLERGYREVVETRLPAVLTLTQDAAEPRYVSMGRLRRAQQREVPVWTPGEADAPQNLPGWPDQEKTVAPRARVKKKFIPDSSMGGTDRMKMLMGDMGSSQSQSDSQDTILEGDAEYLSQQLFRFLKHHEFI